MMEINGSERRKFGPYEVDLHTHELWKHGVRVKLVGQPFEILAVLVRRPGELVTREELRAQLWPGDTFVDFDHGLNAAVNKLRDALCDSAEDPKYIETLPRRGYRFVAGVERSGPEVSSAVSAVEQIPNKSEPVTRQPTIQSTHVPSQSSDAPTHPGVRDGWLPRSLHSGDEWHTTKAKTHLALRVALGCGLGIVVLWVLVNIGILDILRSLHGGDRKEGDERVRSREVMALTNLSDPTSEPAFSPDGSRVAFRRESFLPGMAGLYVKQVGGEDLKQLTNDKNDCCAVWSPDGKWIAFSRLSENQRTIYQMPVEGGEVRALCSTATGSEHAELDWSPDGKSIAFAGRTAEGRTAIFMLSLSDSKPRAVTMPAAGEGDWGPAFSPNGEMLTFVRSDSAGMQGILVMPSGGGEMRRLTTSVGEIVGPPAWSPNGESIIFGVHGQSNGLFRVPVAGGVPAAIREAEGTVSRPAISRRGFRLAFQQVAEGRSISQLDLTPPGQKQRSLVMTLNGEDSAPQLSPDGKQLVFASTRAGGMDLWLTDRDGQNAVQLTAIGTANSPRWSPDGKRIAFDVGLGLDWQQPRAIFTVDPKGGLPRALVQDRYNNPVPSWSRDGKWVYFASDRSGSWQVWKVAAEGGEPVQVTTQGGFAAWEGADGNLYYAKNRYENPELWRVPVTGGAEAPVYPPVRPLDWAAWTVGGKGILFVDKGPNDLPTLSMLDLSALRVSQLAVFEKSAFWLGVSADEKTVVFDQAGKSENHIVVLENFR